MARHSRISRLLGWAGLITCLLILVAWAASLPWGFGRWGSNGQSSWGWAVTGGVLRVHWNHNERFFDHPEEWFGFGESDRYGFELPSMYGSLDDVLDVGIPLWMLFAIVYFPTAILWYRNRLTIKPGHCQRCGYNLTGNTSGRCSECGTSILPQTQEKVTIGPPEGEESRSA